MGRAGYIEDMDGDGLWQWIRWRGAVKSAIRGRKGQAFLKELLGALEALPEKVLIDDVMEDDYGSVCALGALGHQRGIDLSKIDPHDYASVAGAFKIPEALAREIMYLNDEGSLTNSDAARWREMCDWIRSEIKEADHA